MKKIILLSLIFLSFTSCKSELETSLQDKIPTSTQTKNEIDEDFKGIFSMYIDSKASQCHPSNGKAVRIFTSSNDKELSLLISIVDNCNSFYSSRRNVATLTFELDRFSYTGNKLFNTDLTLVEVRNEVDGDPDEADVYSLISGVNPAFNQLSSFVNDKIYWTIKLDPSLGPYEEGNIELPPITKLLDSTTPSSRSEAAENYYGGEPI